MVRDVVRAKGEPAWIVPKLDVDHRVKVGRRRLGRRVLRRRDLPVTFEAPLHEGSPHDGSIWNLTHPRHLRQGSSVWNQTQRSGLMRIADMNWMQVRDHVARDDRAVLPIGSTEQHAYLSLAVDAILSERVSKEAAEPLAVPVFPVIAYGLTPNFVEYPGTVTLRLSTLCAVLTDIL